MAAMSENNGPTWPKHVDQPLVEDRRSAQRYPCEVQTTGHTLGPYGNVTWVAQITDISATGIGLQFRSRVKLGSVLVITLQSASQAMSRPLPVRVMRVTQLDDQTWHLGCAFIRKLKEEDLLGFLDRTP
jgi:hypothetical protein